MRGTVREQTKAGNCNCGKIVTVWVEKGYVLYVLRVLEPLLKGLTLYPFKCLRIHEVSTHQCYFSFYFTFIIFPILLLL